MQQNKTIKIFLASSVTELKYERLELANYINNAVSPILKNGGWNVSLFKCEDDPLGNFGEPSQKVIDNVLLDSDISVFLFKMKAGTKTIHEFDLARELQKEREHGIYVYCFDVPKNDEKSSDLIAFQQRLEKEEFYWKTCDDIDSLKSQFLLGLLKQLLGEKAVTDAELESDIERDGDARFKEYENNEKEQVRLRERLHQDIDGLLKQIKATMEDEGKNIAVRITKTIELYKKADLWASKTNYDKKKYFELLFDYAKFLYIYGLYNDSEEVFLRQIPLADELYNMESEKTTTLYNYIGGVYYEQGDYDKALEFNLKALEISKKVFGQKHFETATIYNDIGTVYNAKGDYNKALKCYFMALMIWEKGSEKDHFDVATSYNNIGSVYCRRGDNDKALEYYFKALAIWEKVHGIEHPDTATSLNNIGLVYNAQRDYDKALEYYSKSLAIKEKVLGEGHPDTAQSYNNIGSVCWDQGDYDKALKYHFKALAIWEEHLGLEHPYTATSYNNIGTVYLRMKKFKDAMKYFEKALLIREAKLGYNNIDTKATRRWINQTKAAMAKRKRKNAANQDY